MVRILLVSLILFLVSCGHSEGPERFTKKFSMPATADETALFQNSLARREFSDESKAECVLQAPQQPYSIKICAHGYYDKSNTMAEVSVFSNSTLLLSSQIDLKSYASSDMNIAADLDQGVLYIAWVSDNPEKQIPSSINLRVIELANKKILFDREIYQQPWGIRRLAMSRHPAANILLFAYNDFSKRDSEYLYLAPLRLEGLGEKKASLSPKAIHLRDKWEKAFPHFWKSADRLFLYHTTGDAWGLLAYRGKSAVAVSEIDGDGEPQNYSIIADENPVNNEIRIWDDSVYYERVTGENRGYYELKKIGFGNTYKPFAPRH